MLVSMNPRYTLTVVFCWLAGVFTGVACSQVAIPPVQDVETAVKARESVCTMARVVAAQAPNDATLQEVVKACNAGDDLKQVARIYGGCSEPTPAPAPAPDAG